MAITFVGANEGADVSTGATCVIPAGVTAGDRLLAILGTNSTSYSHNLPDGGWALLATSQGSVDGGSQFASLFTKIATDTDEGETVDFLAPGAGSAKDVAIIGAWHGSVLTPVLDAFGVVAHTNGGAATTTVTVPILNVSETPATLVSLVSKKGGTVQPSFTPPAGFTLRQTDWRDGSGAIGVAVADGAAGGTGPTAVGTWNSNISSAADAGFLVALREGSAPTINNPVVRIFQVGGWVPAP